MENNGYYSGIGFEQEECDRFLVLRKLIDFDTYVPPKQVLDICSDYLRKYQTVCFTFQQAAYFLFAEIYRGDFKEDPVDKLVQCMANEKSTKIDIENARLEFKINEGIDNFKNKWKTAINAVLRVLFGNNTTIDVYRYNKSGEDEGEYAIYQDELQFWGYVLRTYGMKDYLNFVKRDFKNVSTEYLGVMLFGAVLVSAHHKIIATDEMVHTWLDIKMECYRQVLLEKYGLLHDRIIEIFSLQSKGSNCTLELLDDVAVCTFILENCIEQLDENVNALAEMCVTTRDYTTEAYRINKKKISAVKLKDLK